MISEDDLKIIQRYAKKYKLIKVILFGSSVERADARDIDLGVKGVAPESFFTFCWEIYRDLSKPVDIIDLEKKCLFTEIIERDGIVLYGK